MDEQRSSPRQRMLKSAHVVFNDGHSTINCVVRNLSETGAKLKVADVIGIPQRFDLALPGTERRACRVIWHSATELGVTFVEQGPQKVDEADKIGASPATAR